MREGGTSSQFSRLGAVMVSVALLTSLIGAHVAAPDVRAGLFNPIPADQFEDPQDFFRADDALFFYATSDIKGGRICVVPEDGALSTLSCDSPAWGDANTAVGIGTVFGLLEPAPLRVGTWRLLTETFVENPNDDPIPLAVSAPFTVAPCDGTCDSTISDGVVLQFKATALSQWEVYYDACVAMVLVAAAKELNSLFTDAISGQLLRDALKQKLKLDKQFKWDFGSGTLAIGFSGVSVVFVPATDIIRTGEKKAQAILHQLVCTLGAAWADLNADPPDPAFADVELPTTRPVVPLGTDATDELAVGLDRGLGLGLAVLTALERYQGAVAASDTAGVHRQAAALAQYSFDFVDQTRSTADDLRAYAAELDALTEFADPVVGTDADLTAIQALHDRIANDGFNTDELANLRDIGLTDDQIANMRLQFDIDFTGLEPGKPIGSLLRDAADGIEANLSGLDLLARSAESVAGATNGPPVAAFTAEPPSGPIPLAVTFDASGSSDPDGDDLTYEWNFGDGQTASGAVVLHTFYVSNSYTVTLSVSDGATTTATEKIIKAGTNQQPTANGDFATTDPGTPVEVDVLANDTDPDGDTLTISESSDPPNGTATCPASGPCTYTPDPGFSGAFDEFTYTIADPESATSTATVTVFVNQTPNTNPVAVNDAVTTTVDTPVQFDAFQNDSDPDGDPFFLTSSTDPLHGDATCTGGICTYSPDLGYTGSDSFSYTIIDNRGGSDDGSVSIIINAGPPPGNRPPVANDDSTSASAGNLVVVGPLANDFDPDADALSFTSSTDGANGTVTCSGTACLYSPAPGAFVGADSFTYTIADPDGLSDTATVSVELTNNNPLAFFDETVTGKGLAVVVPVLANDGDFNGHALTVIDSTDGEHGSVVCTGAGECTYAPEADFLGADTFEYTISDGHGGVATGVVSVTVREIIDAGPDWFWREDRELTFEPVVSSAPAFACRWAFGDGTLDSTDCDFAHTYADPGPYTATLTVVVDGGPTVTEPVKIEVLPLPAGGGGGAIGGNGEVVVGTDVTYTLNGDFDRGTFLNVNHDAPHANELRLNGQLRPFPFVNIAASGRGTAIRVDANSGEILGEYLTAPDGMGRDPSRTTVDLHGNVWVANRAELGESGGESKGSVARIGLVLGGTRVDENGSPETDGAYLAPPFAYNTCLDRDGDGRLRTSGGIFDVLAWPNAGGADTHGGVSTAEDECLINYTRVTGAYTRTIAIDPDNDVWVGGPVDRDHEKLDGDTGEPIAGSQINFPACGGYGGLVDGDAVLWSASGLLRYDTAAGTGECLAVQRLRPGTGSTDRPRLVGAVRVHGFRVRARRGAGDVRTPIPTVSPVPRVSQWTMMGTSGSRTASPAAQRSVTSARTGRSSATFRCSGAWARPGSPSTTTARSGPRISTAATRAGSIRRSGTSEGAASPPAGWISSWTWVPAPVRTTTAT